MVAQWSSVSNEAKREKLHLLQKQELLKGHLGKVISLGRLAFIMALRRHLFLYSFLSGLGIVLLWQGIWGSVDWVIGAFGVSESLFPYLITTTMGVVILYSLGVFMSLTSGVETNDTPELSQIKEFGMLDEVVNGKRV